MSVQRCRPDDCVIPREGCSSDPCSALEDCLECTQYLSVDGGLCSPSNRIDCASNAAKVFGIIVVPTLLPVVLLLYWLWRRRKRHVAEQLDTGEKVRCPHKFCGNVVPVPAHDSEPFEFKCKKCSRWIRTSGTGDKQIVKALDKPSAAASRTGTGGSSTASTNGLGSTRALLSAVPSSEQEQLKLAMELSRQEAMFRERQESVLVAQVQKANGLIPAAADEAAVVVDRSDIVISVPVEPAAAAIQSDSDPESGRDSAKDGGGSAGDSARTIAGPEQTLNGTHDTGEPNGESRGYSGIYSAPASSAEAKAGRPEPL